MGYGGDMADPHAPRAGHPLASGLAPLGRHTAAAQATIPSDEDLLRLVLHGEQAALTCLFDRHRDALHRLLRGLTGDDFLAEDLLQETFLRLWRAPQALGSVAKGRAYIYRMAVNLAQDHARRQRRERELPRERPPRPGDQTALADAVGERDALGRALRVLSPPQRVVIGLHYHADQPIAEVARILGIPQGTVKTRLSRAYRRLAAALREEDAHAGNP